jgi:hypothetical protein
MTKKERIKKLEDEKSKRLKGLDLINMNEDLFFKTVGRRRVEELKNDILDHIIRLTKEIRKLENKKD